MMLHVVDWLMVYLSKHNLVPEEEREVYAYSLEVALSAAIFWLMMAALTLIFGQIGPTLIYLGVFFFLRSAIGGYHASTHLRCSVVSVVVYLGFIWCYTHLSEGTAWIVLLSGAAVLLIFCFAPVDHPNKPFSTAERAHYRQQSCGRAGVLILLQVLLLVSGWTSMAFCVAFGAAQAAVFMFIAYLMQKGGETYGSAVS